MSQLVCAYLFTAERIVQLHTTDHVLWVIQEDSPLTEHNFR